MTRQTTRAATRIMRGLRESRYLCNLDARGDWGFAGEYVDAMRLKLQQHDPDDSVVSTDETIAVREIGELGLGWLGLDSCDFVEIDPCYVRPAEVDLPIGNAATAPRRLCWVSRVLGPELVTIVVDADLELPHREQGLMAAGRGTTRNNG